MLAEFVSSRDCKRECMTRPLNAVLFPDAVFSRINADRLSQDVRAAVLAEIATRYYLRPESDSPFGNILVSGLGERCFQGFQAWCEKAVVGKPDSGALRRLLGEAGGELVAERMCGRFQRLLSADGMIPVFDGDGDAYLLPFRFAGTVSPDSSPRAFDAEDNPIAGWTEELRHLPVHVGGDIHIDIAPSADHPLDLDGGSLLLPVLAAWWRREGCIPTYDPLRVYFTGSFRGGLLRCVETEEKRKKIKQSVKNGILVHPIPENADLDANTIRAGGDSGAVFEAVREITERHAGFDTEYALKRLAAFETDVRQTRTTDWDGMLLRLGNLLEGLDPDLDAQEHLHAVLLIAAANCHAGHTAKAAAWNAKARSLVGESKSVEHLLLRAWIEQLVILQDSEDFDGIFDLIPDLEARIASFATAETGSERAVDLRMRFSGSMGQFLTYANLAGVRADVCTPESARRYFKTAFDCAKELHGKAHSPDEKTLRAADVAQDANYLLLWAAFFDRAGIEDALAQSLRLAKRSGGAAEKNKRFARRNYALGLYRDVLAEETPPMPNLGEYRAVIERQWPEDWIAGTTAKYLGAAAAANGDEEEATRLFDIAAKAIDAGAREIIGVLRMTIHAEAFRSLRRFPALGPLTEEYRQEALRFFSYGEPAAKAKDDWRAWLEAPDSTPFPGLSYWY